MKRLFKESHLHLFKELHPTKNVDVDFSILYENSGRKVWWQCSINQEHVWQQSITNRTRQGYGCPFCAGRRTLPKDSFAALHPDIMAELYPEKNYDFDPFKYRPNSSKVVWWKCNNGHEWQQSIQHRVRRGSKCKECRRQEDSLASKYPEIAKEWHPTKNKPLTPNDVFPSYRKKVWWKCQKDPAHEWEVTVSTRVFSRSGCPKCNRSQRTIRRLPPLSEYSPLLAQQWHPTKNGNLLPSDVTPGSGQKVWWICPINSEHEWLSRVYNRVRGRGCPYCANVRVSPENSLAVRFPKIAMQWHPTKNGCLTPSDFSYGSSQKVWWECLSDKSHEWQATITERTQRNKDKCPICTKSRFFESNSLQAIHPEIAAQWHPTKNGPLRANQVPRASSKKVWWQCPNNPEHGWEAIIKNRTVLGSGCPHCFKEKNIIRLSEHLFDLVHTEIDYYHVFLSNLRTLHKLSEHDFHGSPRLMQPYYRMIYSSIITSLETYLSDAFYKNVSSDQGLLEKCIASNPEFSKKQYSLAEVVDWHKNLRKRVTEYLFNIIWHNLPKIQKMYKDVLGVNFLEDISRLHKAVTIRHDLVHRNGRTKSGVVHKLNKKQLLQLISDVKDFVSHVNKQLMEKKTEPVAAR